MNKLCFASDNWAPVHPVVLEAILKANDGDAPGYGGDAWTLEAQNSIQKVFNKPSKVFFIPTGTGSNVLALKLMCKNFESIICTDIAHINYQESGAAEAVIGCKQLTVPHKNGKITPEAILKRLRNERAFGKHSTVPRIVSITQPTEVGTVYTLEELRAISTLCKQEKLAFHVDGSRLYNAAVALKCSLNEMTEDVDVLSLGGTKNGLMSAEAVLIFNPDFEMGCEHLQKQTLQLLSKMRYLSVQYSALFQNDLWHSLASHANQKAEEIAVFLKKIPEVKLSYPVDTNQLFFTVPADLIPLIQEKVHCYPWDLEKNEVRFIASWNTSEKEIEDLKAVFETLTR